MTSSRVIAFGGDDYVKDSWNESAIDSRPAGRSALAYVLAAWLEGGHGLSSWLPRNETVPKEIPDQAREKSPTAAAVGDHRDHRAPRPRSTPPTCRWRYKLDQDAGTIGLRSSESVREIVLDSSSPARTGSTADIEAWHFHQFSISSGPGHRGRAGRWIFDLR